MVVINAENVVLGRMATDVAKRLIKGETVQVVNAEMAVISGEPSTIVEKYRKRRLQKDKANPEHSAHWPRRPDMLVKRIIRGMLPFKHPRGRRAFRNLRVYMGVPVGIAISKDSKQDFKVKSMLHSRSLSISDLCKQLGYNG